jgi:hypothetical protein
MFCGGQNVTGPTGSGQRIPDALNTAVIDQTEGPATSTMQGEPRPQESEPQAPGGTTFSAAQAPSTPPRPDEAKAMARSAQLWSDRLYGDRVEDCEKKRQFDECGPDAYQRESMSKAIEAWSQPGCQEAVKKCVETGEGGFVPPPAPPAADNQDEDHTLSNAFWGTVETAIGSARDFASGFAAQFSGELAVDPQVGAACGDVSVGSPFDGVLIYRSRACERAVEDSAERQRNAAPTEAPPSEIFPPVAMNN